MLTQPLIKVCGTTSVADGKMAAAAGADYLGIVVNHPPSPRSVDAGAAKAIAAAVAIPVVVVTVNLGLDELLRLHEQIAPRALQLHGDESPQTIQALASHRIRVWATAGGAAAAARRRALELSQAGAGAVLIDSRTVAGTETVYGGTGITADWDVAADLATIGIPLILAGGLTPDNVTEAVRRVQPWMVDVASGVEATKGVKDAARLSLFVAAVRSMRAV